MKFMKLKKLKKEELIDYFGLYIKKRNERLCYMQKTCIAPALPHAVAFHYAASVYMNCEMLIIY